MAQAVAAQAFARAATLVPERATAYQRAAHAAYAVIPRHLLTSVAAGPWIRLYSFQSTAVLNAQLQAVISLASYATDSEDPDAANLAARMQRSAAAMLARFDTGYWTYYALPRDYSDLDYQQYVVQLLTKLAKADPRFADASKRFATYEKQPPAFKLGTAGVGQVRFWLSKPSSVAVTSAAGPSRRLSLGDGWHTLAWSEPKRPGIYAVKLSAVDRAGNRASFEALPIVHAIAPAGSGDESPHREREGWASVVRDRCWGRRSRAGCACGQARPASDPRRDRLAGRFGRARSRPDRRPPARTCRAAGDRRARRESAAGGRGGAERARRLRGRAGPAGTERAAVDSRRRRRTRPALPRMAPRSPSCAMPSIQVHRAWSWARRSTVRSAPKATVAALGRALTAVAPDTIAFRPAPAPATGAWTIANLPQLSTALTQAFGAAPPVLLDGVSAPTPAGDATTLASLACGSGLSGLVFDRLADNAAVPGASNGIYDASGVAKPGLPALATAVANAQRGLVVCPGLATPALATTLEYPTELASNVATGLQLGCALDCLYLVTLNNAAGPSGRRDAGRARGRCRADDRHAAEGEARVRLVSRRREARQPGEPGARRPSAERPDRRPVGSRAMRSRRAITVVGCHAGGEVGNVVVGGVLPPVGATVFEQMQTLRADDSLRKLLLREPRGSVAVHANLIVPATRPECDAGFIIMEPTEYPAMSGSNTICVATVLLETGMVELREPETVLRLEAPGGVVEVRAACRDGRVESVELTNVPSFADRLDAELEVDGLGTLTVDVAYGGMWYAIADASALGFSLDPSEARELSRVGELIRVAARAAAALRSS